MAPDLKLNTEEYGPMVEPLPGSHLVYANHIRTLAAFAMERPEILQGVTMCGGADEQGAWEYVAFRVKRD